MIENPFWLGPADANYFVGRNDLISAWEERLKTDKKAEKSVKNWMIYADGGMGKSSLLIKLQKIAKEKYNTHTIFMDFGDYGDNNVEDFFEIFEHQIRQAGDFGTRLRNLFNLTPDANELKIIMKSASGLSKLAGLGVNFNALAVSPSFPELSAERPEGIAIRMSYIEAGLRAISQRIGTVVVFIDQLGKAQDSPLLCKIARLLLSSILNIRKDGCSDRIIFVVAIRPERYGQLIYQIQQDQLFSDHLFERKYLNPFTESEAREAIKKRGKALITPNLVSGIVSEVTRKAKLDPYTLIQAANGVWAYLYEGEKQRSPSEISKEEIHEAITKYYQNLTRYYQQLTLQWSVLKLLTLSPIPLTADEIVEELAHSKLKGKANTFITSKEAEEILLQLLNQNSYQIVSMQSHLSGSPRYLIAHDLLRDAIKQQIPEEQRELEEAAKLLTYAVNRYQQRHDVLTGKELEIIWQNQKRLQLTSLDWEAIAFSLLDSWELSFVYWLKSTGEELPNAIQCIVKKTTNKLVLLRSYLFLALLLRKNIFLVKAIREIGNNKGFGEGKYIWNSIKGITAADEKKEACDILGSLMVNSKDEGIRQEAARGLARLGESAKEILVDLIRNSADEGIRRSAAEGLAGLGESAKEVLADLARNNEDEGIRRSAAEGLARLGESAKEVLADLARNSKDKYVRHEATRGLTRMGESAKEILADLARKSKDEGIRRSAAAGLAGLGESAKEVLADLARNSKDEDVRLEAAEGLARLGEANLACEVLVDLARNSNVAWVRQEATRHLAWLGEPAKEILADLARKSKDEGIRRSAAAGLAGLGESAKEVLADLARNSKDEDVRLEAAEGLARLGEANLALKVLANLACSSEDDDVRRSAAEGLAGLGEVDLAYEVLTNLARNSENDVVRQEATSGLAGLGESAKEVLADLARNSEVAGVRRSAAAGLAGLGESAKEVLADLARNSKDKYVRQEATSGLAGLGESAKEVLVDLACTSEDEDVRQSAAEGLAGLGEVDLALKVLADLARSSENHDVRRSAAEGLTGLGESAKEVLVDLARNSEDDFVRRSAAEGLVLIGESAKEMLVDLASNSKHEDVRLEAAEGLAILGEIIHVYTIALRDPLGDMSTWFFF